MVKILVSGRAPSGFVATYAGHFKLTQNRAVIEAGINIVVSLICVKLWGIYGVLLGTIAALLYRANDMIIYCNNRILKRSNWSTYKWWVLNIGLFIGFKIIFDLLVPTISSYAQFFVVAVIVMSIVGIVSLITTYLLSNKAAKLFLMSFLPKFKKKENE